MFRRLPSSLPPDPTAPADLEKLGYFINTSDQVRMIRNPEQKYQYKIDRNDRVNDVFKEAMNTCIRANVRNRLLELGLEVMRLPNGAQQNDNHVPILVSADLKQKRRILVIFGERGQDLGILSYRVTGEQGVKYGSVIELVEAALNRKSDAAEHDLGIILANPGQLNWFRGEGRAVSDREWLNLPRQSAVHEPFRIDPVKNRVPGNTNYNEHIRYIFENVLRGRTSSEAKMDIIGLEYTGTAVVQYLADHWIDWRTRINGICLGNPQHDISEIQNAEMVHFIKTRTRAYFVSDAEMETPIPGRDRFGCNCYASGEKLYEEGILVKGWRSMLDWFNMIYVIRDYAEPTFALLVDEQMTDTTDRNGWH